MIHCLMPSRNAQKFSDARRRVPAAFSQPISVNRSLIVGVDGGAGSALAAGGTRGAGSALAAGVIRGGGFALAACVTRGGGFALAAGVIRGRGGLFLAAGVTRGRGGLFLAAGVVRGGGGLLLLCAIGNRQAGAGDGDDAGDQHGAGYFHNGERLTATSWRVSGIVKGNAARRWLFPNRLLSGPSPHPVNPVNPVKIPNRRRSPKIPF